MTDKITTLLAELSASAKPGSAAWVSYDLHAEDRSWAAYAEAIVMKEFIHPFHPDDETPAALTVAVEEARVKLRGALFSQHVMRRDQVRNAKLRIDTENEINGTSYAYPSWVTNFLKEHSID